MSHCAVYDGLRGDEDVDLASVAGRGAAVLVQGSPHQQLGPPLPRHVTSAQHRPKPRVQLEQQNKITQSDAVLNLGFQERETWLSPHPKKGDPGYPHPKKGRSKKMCKLSCYKTLR